MYFVFFLLFAGFCTQGGECCDGFDCLEFPCESAQCHQHGWYYLNENWYRVGTAVSTEYPPRNLTLDEAEAYCDKLGSKLVKITCHNSNADAHKMVTYPGLHAAWIGLRQDQAAQQYKWQDGSDTEYTNWAFEPDHQKNGARIHKDYNGPAPDNTAGGWCTADCQSKNAVICQKPSTPKPDFECTEPWMYYAGMWFWTSPADQTACHTEAQEVCASKGAELASEMYDAVLRLAFKQMIPDPAQDMWVLEPCTEPGKCRFLTAKHGPELSYDSCLCDGKKRFTCMKLDRPAELAKEPPMPPLQTTAATAAEGAAWHCKDNSCQTCNYRQTGSCSWPYYNSKPYCEANCGK